MGGYIALIHNGFVAAYKIIFESQVEEVMSQLVNQLLFSEFQQMHKPHELGGRSVFFHVLQELVLPIDHYYYRYAKSELVKRAIVCWQTVSHGGDTVLRTEEHALVIVPSLATCLQL